jgi:hypothetical protein
MTAFWKGLLVFGLEGRGVMKGEGVDVIYTDSNLNPLPILSLA